MMISKNPLCDHCTQQSYGNLKGLVLEIWRQNTSKQEFSDYISKLVSGNEDT